MGLRIAVFSLLLAFPAQAAQDSKLEEVVLLSLSSVDAKAVVRLPTGELQILEVGGPIPGTAAVVEEVLPDRLVLEEHLAANSSEEPGEKRTVWLFKSEGSGQKSRILVLHRSPPDDQETKSPAPNREEPEQR